MSDDPIFIVAEISKNWPEQELKGRSLQSLFEEVINKNWARRYRLHSFQLNRWSPEEGLLNETLIAVFEWMPPG